jgi:PhnB protein
MPIRATCSEAPCDHLVGDPSMKLNTYVNFAGKCAEAFRFYEKLLGGKIGMVMTRGELPDQSLMTPESKHSVVHARISIGGAELIGSDVDHAQPMRSAYLSLSVQSDTEAERIFSALSDGGHVFTPIQETFFATRFAQLRDRFGINWMLTCERRMSERP